MDKNPFGELYELIKEGTKTNPSFFIAKVTSPLPSLEVAFEGLELDKDNLMISKSLLLENSLTIGSKVLLYRLNDSTFVVLNEVVSI